MFSSSGLFKTIACPSDSKCSLPNCLFRHADPTNQLAPKGASISDVNSDAPRKRRKLDSGPINTGKPIAPFVGALSNNSNAVRERQSDSRDHDQDLKDAGRSCDRAPILEKAITPPKSRRTTAAAAKPAPARVQESLNPRRVETDPAGHQTRVLYLRKLHEEMSRLNNEIMRSEDPKLLKLKLNDSEMITLALDEEEELARGNAAVYSNIIKRRMLTYRKMTIENWRDLRLKSRDATSGTIPAKETTTVPNPTHTGLSSAEELQLIRHLVADQIGLERFGYVTSIPTEEQIQAAEAGVAASNGWEQCDRCKTRFQVFPDRREDGALTSGGTCTHHPGKALLSSKDPTHSSRVHRERSYTCCNEHIGTSTGCTTTPCHVFMVKDPKRLASVLQFEKTPINHEANSNRAIAFDCEMGFTTKGFELIRITATGWPGKEELLDVLVRPLGTVLDLNSRYSGVWPKQFTEALPHNSSKGQGLDEGEPKLRIVNSPVVARELLFSFLTPETPLIGHAIDNDLNAVRIVHPCIVDTALLYPHPRGGLPLRRGLKALAKQLLNRDIQNDEASGHDSKEDAWTTGDLVRVKAGHKWKALNATGWRFDDGVLSAPPRR